MITLLLPSLSPCMLLHYSAEILCGTNSTGKQSLIQLIIETAIFDLTSQRALQFQLFILRCSQSSIPSWADITFWDNTSAGVLRYNYCMFTSALSGFVSFIWCNRFRKTYFIITLSPAVSIHLVELCYYRMLPVQLLKLWWLHGKVYYGIVDNMCNGCTAQTL